MQQQSIQVPKDASQLAALRERRDEMETQLDALSDRRQRLVNERANAQANGNQAMVGELDAQLRETSARLRRVETDKLAMYDAISAALRQGVSGQEVQVMPGIPVPPSPDIGHLISVPPLGRDTSPPPAYDRMLFLGGIGLLLIGFVMYRWGVTRGRRQAGTLAPGDAQLRQAVDAIAIEVERISENQRYVTKLLSEQNQAGELARPLSEAERARQPR
jgi:hypothetical protein